MKSFLNSTAFARSRAYACFFAVLLLLINRQANAQQDNLTCNAITNWVNPSTTTTFAGLAATPGTFTGFTGSGVSGAANIVDDNLSNAGTFQLVSRRFGTLCGQTTDASGSLIIGGTSNYPVGNYVGIITNSNPSNFTTLTISAVSGTTTVGTAETSPTVSDLGNGTYMIGFLTNGTGTFNGIKIEATLEAPSAVACGLGAGTLTRSFEIVNAFQVKYCDVTGFACNTVKNASIPSFKVTATSAGAGVGNLSNVTSPSSTDYATFSTFVVSLGSRSISVTDNAITYPTGTFAGFEIENAAALSVSVLGNFTLQLYNGTTKVGEASGSDLLVGASVLSSSGRKTVGLVSTAAFNQVRIIDAGVSVGFGETRVYNAVFKKFCESTDVIVCNAAPTKLTSPTYPLSLSTTHTTIGGTACVGCSITNQDNVIDADITNYATIDLLTSVNSTGAISVKKELSNFPAGSFAGFDVGNSSLLGLNLLGSVTITTFLNGTQQETATGSSGLANIGLLSSNRQTIGFVTASDKPYNEIQIKVTKLVDVSLGQTLVYGAVIKTFCVGPELVCNTPTHVTEGAGKFPVIISNANTGTSGVSLGSVNNAGNAIDTDPASYAEIAITAGVGGSASLAIKDAKTTYPAGTFAGFDINSPALVGASVLGGLRIETYLNGVATGDFFENGTTVGASVPLLSGTGRQVVGFLTKLPFNEVKLTVSQTVGVSVGTTQIFGLVLTRFCIADQLACNTLTSVTNPGSPVFVDGKNTGITSIVCAACTVNNPGNVIDTDPATAATIVLAAGVASSGTFAVANALETYLPTSFAGFDVETTTLLSAGALSNATISLYNDGALVQTGTGDALIVGAASSLLTGTARQIVGLVATASYDEVKITFNQLVGANLGNIKIYGAIFDKLCQGTIACNNSFLLTQPDFPVVINSARTGVTGAVCALCNVKDPWNVISASKTDFAQVSVVANVGASASLSVLDPISTYPIGTTAGFTIRNVNNLVQLDLINSITIETWNNNVLQETKAGSALLNLNLLNIITAGTGDVINPSFVTTKPFDEIRIRFAALASVANTVNVYGAFVDTRGTVSGGALSCNIVYNPDFNVTQINVPVPGNVSTNDKVPTGTTYGPTATAGGSNPAGATFTLNTDGTYTFTATTAGIYTYQVPVCVPDLGCTNVPLVITVTDPTKLTNPPVANTDIVSTIGADSGPVVKTINVRANDAAGNAGGTLGVPTAVTAPAHGTAVISGGNINYTPAAGYYGSDVFTYTVCETPSTLCATATVYVTVTRPGATNTTSAADDYVSTAAGITATGNVSTNDTDSEGNTQTVTAQSITNAKGTFTLTTLGAFTFVPASGITGPVDFIYTTCDNGTPSACANATLHILVNPASTNVVNPDFNVTQVNVPVPGNVSTNDKVPAGTTYGTPTPGGSNPAGGGTITLNSDGSYTFTGTLAGVYTYSVPVCIPGVTPCGSAPLTITVTDPTITTNKPVANKDIAKTTGAATNPASATINIKANDGPGNAGGILGTPTITTQPAHGTASIDGSGNAVYTPTAGYYGDDSFTYTVCETPGTNLCATATVYVTVKQPGGTNTTSASDDYVSTAAGVTATGNVSTNDTDPEGNTHSVTAQNVTNAKGVFTLLADGSFTFVPASGITGPVDFIYTTCDNGTPSACATATLHVLVKTPVTVVTNPDFNVTQINVPVPGNVSTNDKVPAGTTYGTPTPGGSNPAGGGTITLNTDGSYSFTGTIPGVYTYDVPVCVPGVTPCGSSPLVITVTDPTKITNKPVANTDIASVNGAPSSPASVTIKVKANDGPGNLGGTLGDPVPATPAHGTVTVSNGNVVYTPTAGYYGPDMFTYTICETPGTNLCATATVYVTVKQPGSTNTTSAADDYVSTQAGVIASGNVSTNDTDPEGNTQTVTPQTINNSNGTLTVLADGSFTFAPVTGFSGPVDFIYTTCDNGTPSACATATLHILVNPNLPNLTTSQLFSSLQITNGQTIDYVVSVRNVGLVSTSGEVQFFVTNYTSATGLTVTLNPNTTVTIGGSTVTHNNSDFDVTSNSFGFTFKSKPGIVISSGGRKFISFKISRTAGSSGTATNTVTITDGTGGNELPYTDNTISNTLLKP